jgi:ubiquinone/menaquinone biosynthesis C-methylase UbiE
VIDADAFNAFEAAGWETKAPGYDRFFGAITGRVIEPLLDAAEVGEGTRVLDVATGPGYVAAAAAGRGATVVGLDISSSMVALASRLHPGLEFRRGDVHQLDIEDGSFDAVVGNFLILHLGRPEQAVSELARVLAPGGALALTVWDVPERARLFGLFLDAVSDAGAGQPTTIPKGPDFFRFSHDHEFDALLRGAGLEDREVETVAFEQRFADVDELYDDFVAGTVRTAALIEGQDPETQARIREAFRRRAHEYDHEYGLSIPVSVKLASGRLR